MKQVKLENGMDCTNLRTRGGWKVHSVKRNPSANEYPFDVHFEGDAYPSPFTFMGEYYQTGHPSDNDIFELEGGDEGYTPSTTEVSENEALLLEILEANLPAKTKLHLIKILLKGGE